MAVDADADFPDERDAWRLAPSRPWTPAPTLSERISGALADPCLQQTIRIGAIAGGLLVLFGLIIWFTLFASMPRLPPADQLWTLNRAPAVQFVDANGRLLAVRGHLYGPVVRGEELPAYLGQAFIAAEDQRFMDHGGVDLQSILRALAANVSAGRTVQGGSTLTQQLVKNLLVGNDQTLRRKAQEARLAMDMEKVLSKEQILDLYLNRVYLGANAYGVEAAAQTYFGKSAARLSLAEAAFLAALPKAPTRYAEDRSGPETTGRIAYVLDRMVACGFISAEAAASAKREELNFLAPQSEKPISGHVLDTALSEARAVLPHLPPDVVIALTIDGALQRQAEAALVTALSAPRLGASQGAIVVMDPHGTIAALVGGKDYQTSQFNRATQALRQPGSTFKTFVYAAALESGLDPLTVRNDEPVAFAGWQPGNYEAAYRGPITLARALAVSSNSVAVQLGSEIGAGKIASLAKRFGISSPLRPYPSLALGTEQVTLLELTRAYGVLANSGRRLRPHLVAEIRDQRGAILYRSPPADEPQVYSGEDTARLTGMLVNVVQSGTGGAAQVPGWQVAGKTGTSQSWRDAWFIGYSARFVAGVWIGNDDDKAMRKVTGGGAAASLFAKVMIAAHRGLQPQPLPGADLGAAWLDGEIDDPLEEGELDYPDLTSLGHLSQPGSSEDEPLPPIAREASGSIPAQAAPPQGRGRVDDPLPADARRDARQPAPASPVVSATPGRSPPSLPPPDGDGASVSGGDADAGSATEYAKRATGADEAEGAESEGDGAIPSPP